LKPESVGWVKRSDDPTPAEIATLRWVSADA
jgi:hypothetical protein